MKRPLPMLLACLLTGSGAWAGGAGPTLQNPLQTLRQRHLIESATFERAHATSQVQRLKWRDPAAELFVLLGSAAQTPVQAEQVRELSVWVHLPAGDRLTRPQAQALNSAAQWLSRWCFRQSAPGLPRVLMGLADQPPRAGVQRALGQGMTVDIAAPAEFRASGLDVQVSAAAQPGGALGCAMPVLP
ncbi:hypothetical protein GCM10022631_38880 [Deinococcus rubellus]|uniref:Uncharacterized protein n=1 Tax=Deinococcus rubellus TaxID=1889240 RepID=A0ABY5YDV2_9DEIO|nr:hypothetical protein [Deinococcus rubellus]UWX63025.1 hypothetical protein N0D28_09645 [Deinococcus rubellus]